MDQWEISEIMFKNKIMEFSEKLKKKISFKTDHMDNTKKDILTIKKECSPNRKTNNSFNKDHMDNIKKKT